MFQQRTIESYCAFCRALSWVSEVFFSRATRSLVGRRPSRLRAKAEDTSGEATRKNADHYNLRLDRNRKPRMRSLGHQGYPSVGVTNKGNWKMLNQIPMPTWKILNEALTRKKSRSQLNTVLTSDGQEISVPGVFANRFCSYFSCS